MRDPFGDTNIDTHKDTDAGKWARLVHRVEGPIAELVPDKKLAIKGTGLNMNLARTYLERGGRRRSNLTDQFRNTLELSRKQQEYAPQGIGGLVMVNEVYGMLRYADSNGQQREWMLMEQVEGTPVQNVELVQATIGRRGGIEFAFSASEHPELAQLAGGILQSQSEYTTFGSLRRALNRELEMPDFGFDSFSDLHGNNLLQHESPDGGVRYTAIDIDPR